mmetsp:Transcript_20727/g.31791  ORF Transcript_20727/g.31791 Transcript_20727/m.31791 type:complete len:265 (-) Transcript_20727:1168-1962(-)
MLRVRERHGRRALGVALEGLLNLLDLIFEQLVDHLSSLFVDVVFYKGALGERVEVLKHLDGVGHGGDVLESESNDVLVHNLQALALLLEVLAVVVVPLGDLHVQDIVLKVLDVLQMLGEHAFQLKQVLSVLGALGATEHRHHLLLSLTGELQLAFTDLHEVFATLDEGFVLGEDGLIGVQLPGSTGGVLLNHLLHLEADSLPLTAAVDALLEVSHALLDVALEHVVLVDLGAASLDDLVADLGEQPLHALGGVVVLAQFPDDSH